MKRLFLLLFFLGFTLFLLAEERWVIEVIEVEIDGMTKEEPFRKFLSIKELDIFDSLEDLEKALDAVKNQINNNRIFKEGALVQWNPLDGDGDTIPVEVSIKVSDSWNMIALPYGQFDSNTGLELSIKVRDYNFLGYMNTLTMDLEYMAEENSLQLSLFLPVDQLEMEFNYEISDEGNQDLIHEYFFSTAYKWPVTLMDHEYTIKAKEGIYVSPQDSSDTMYLKSSLNFYTDWVIPLEIYQGYKPVYHADLGAFVSYLPSFTENISELRDGVYTKFEHSLAIGGANWEGNNYKEGMVYHLGNYFQYHIDKDILPYDRWSGNLTASAALYRDWYPWGLSVRAYGRHDLFRQDTQGEFFRGILDNDISSRGGVFLNSAIYLTVWNWDPVWEWYGGPTLDVGYLYDVPDGQDNLVMSAGLEGLAFPYFMRSLFARFSLGLDIKGLDESTTPGFGRFSENWEFFFGLGSFY